MAHRLSYGLLLTALITLPVQASTLPESCTDSRGRVITVETDYVQEELVRSVSGRIRYNPRVLPEMAPSTRLFFVAQACARASSAADTPTLAQAHRADCVAYRMLKANVLLNDSELTDLARQLVFTAAEWEKLPGPPRRFDFTDCAAAGTVLRLPLATPPSLEQSAWNACAHACGDRLWHCQQGSADNACLNHYDTCLKGCGEPPAATR